MECDIRMLNSSQAYGGTKEMDPDMMYCVPLWEEKISSQPRHLWRKHCGSTRSCQKSIAVLFAIYIVCGRAEGLNLWLFSYPFISLIGQASCKTIVVEQRMVNQEDRVRIPVGLWELNIFYSSIYMQLVLETGTSQSCNSTDFLLIKQRRRLRL